MVSGDKAKRMLQTKGGFQLIKIGVTITSINNKMNHVQNYIETDSLVGATRVMMTFKAKRGYRVIEYHIQEVGVLV